MMWIVLALGACHPGGGEEARALAAPELSLELPPLIDPKELTLAEEEAVLRVDVDAEEEGCVTTLELSSSGGQTRTLEVSPEGELGEPVEVRWDGLDDEGFFFDPGEVFVLAQAECPHTAGWTEGSLWVARLGIQAIDLVDLPGASDQVPLADTLGRWEVQLHWRWQALSGEGWVDVPGTLLTTHVIYTTAGPPQLRDGSELGFAPNVAWVGVLDQTAADLAGLEPDPASVLDALRDALYEDPWLIYNPSDGAYSGYSGEYIYWDYAWSDLSDWLDRVDGVELYCHSVSCLFSVLANHWGVYASQQVLGVGFTTNLGIVNQGRCYFR